MRLWPFCSLLLIFSLVVPGVHASSDTYDLTPWANVLETYVDENGYVDYQALNSNRENLDSYISMIKNTGPRTSPTLFPGKMEQLAYYINAYNALVFQGVLDRGPEQKSVWSGLISGLNFFVRMKIELDGKKTNLRNLENKIIRDQFKDPRIHAALNCASISCPRLPQQPFEPESLENQLDAAMGEFVGSENNVQIDAEENRVYLSAIFDWFDDDFLEYEQSQGNKNPTLIDYVNRYRDPDQQIDTTYQIKFIDYNKGVNSQQNRS